MDAAKTTETPTPRVAIVTGAAQGIGYVIAHRLADDGLDVAINDISSKSARVDEVVREIQKKGRKSVAVLADVSVEDDVKAMVQKTVKELGGLDCMIANAGIVPIGPFLESSVQQLERTLSINVCGTMLCFKYAALQMVEQGRGGRLIAASSAAGKEAMAYLSAYSASKFAVRGLVQAVALELVPHRITANAYAPGAINSGIKLEGDTSAQQLAPSPPGVQIADPDVVASLVSYLCKPEAYFINGQTISMDGGWRPS